MIKRTSETELFEYNFNNLNIKIKVGEVFDEILKQHVFVAQSNYKNVFSISESREKSIRDCIRKIKFKEEIANGKIKLIKENIAIELAKKSFYEHFKNDVELVKNTEKLSFESYTEEEIMMINILYSRKDNNLDNKDEMPDVFAIILVNLITGKCEIVAKEKFNFSDISQ